MTWLAYQTLKRWKETKRNEMTTVKVRGPIKDFAVLMNYRFPYRKFTRLRKDKSVSPFEIHAMMQDEMERVYVAFTEGGNIGDRCADLSLLCAFMANLYRVEIEPCEMGETL
jgi:hypothetical protein